MHCMLRADSRAAWMAGNSNEMRMPIMAMTTRSSTKVKAKWRLRKDEGRFNGNDKLRMTDAKLYITPIPVRPAAEPGWLDNTRAT